MDPRMKQQWLRFLLAVFIAGSWLSLEVVQCQKMPKGTYNISYCYNKTSGKTCFTTILANNSNVWRKNFTAAKDLCKAYVPGSSLMIINSLKDQRSVEVFFGRQVFESQVVLTDARKISARKRLEWSWVNGYQTIPNEVKDTDRPFHGGACVVFEVGKPLAYCVDNIRTEYHYICEYSDRIRINIYQQNNKYYFGSNGSATWYDARSDCLLLGGDLASLVDLERINGSSWLKDKNRYWIGLFRNQWFWNSTGAAIIYTNWEGGYPEDSDDKECICLYPKCSMVNKVVICDDRKWWSCNCNRSYPIICQHEEAKEIVDPTAMWNLQRFTPFTTATTTITPISAPISTSLTIVTTINTSTSNKTTLETRNSSINLSDVQTTAFTQEMIAECERYVTWLGISLAICATLFSVAMTYIIFTKIRKRIKRTVQTKSSLHPVRDELQSSTDAYEILAPGDETGTKTYVELQLYETVEDDTKQDTKKRNLPNTL